MSDLALTINMQAIDRMTAPFRKMLQSNERLRNGLSGTAGGFERLQQASEGMEHMRAVAERAEKVRAPLKRILHSSNALSSSLTDTAGSVRQLEKTAEDLDAFRSLHQAARQNENALQAAQDKTRTLALNMQNTEKVTRKMRSEFTAARRDVVRLKASKLDIIRSTDTLRATLRGAGVDTRNLGRAQGKLKADLDAARVAAERQAKSMEVAQQRAQRVAHMQERFGRMQSMRTHMAIGGATAMATGGAGLFGLARMMQTGIDFEQQMAAVAAVGNISRDSERFAALEQQALNLGKDTGVGALNVAAAQGFMARAGMNPDDILKSTSHVLNLSQATDTDAGRTSDLLTNIMGAFKIENEDLERAADTLAATTTAANVDLEQLGQTVEYFGSIAKQADLSLEETAAMAGLLGNVGIQGTKAGTALRAMLARLSNEGGTAQKTLASLGIELKDESGDLRGLPLIFAEVAKATKDMGSAERLGTFMKVAGTEAGTAMANLIENQGGDIKGITKFAELLSQQTGAAARIAEGMRDTMQGDLNKMSGTFDKLQANLTKLNITPLRDLTQWATKMIERFDQWVEKNPVLAATLMKVTAGAAVLVTSLGALATATAGILMPIVMARYAFLGLGLSIRSIPLFRWLQFLGTGLLVLYNCCKPFAEFVQDIGRKLRAMFGFGDDDDSDDERVTRRVTMQKVTENAPRLIPTAKGVQAAAAASVVMAGAAAPALATPPSVIEGSRYEINVQAPIGLDERLLAEKIRAELEEREHQQRSTARSVLYDGVS